MKKLTRITPKPTNHPKQATAGTSATATTTATGFPGGGGGGMTNKSCFKVTLLAATLALALYQSQGNAMTLRKMTPTLLPPTPLTADEVRPEEDSFDPSTRVYFDVGSTTSITTTGGIFFCGYPNFKLAAEVFPDFMNRWWGGFDNPTHQELRSHHSKRLPNSNDILIMGMHGPCQNKPRSFPGKALFVNGEPRGDNIPKTVKLAGRQQMGEDVYQIGLLPDTPHSVLMYHGAWNLMQMDEHLWPTLWDPDKKPKNSGKYNGLVYMNRQCYPHRENAVNAIANIMKVYYGGKCKGNADIQPDKFQKMPSIPPKRHWKYNRDVYSEYKFCFAMENSLTNHYLSEKIVIAFLSGCIPIYFGSQEVYDVFNRDAFVFYNPQDPQPALTQLRLLANNETAYQQMLDQPIMANGNETVRKYFSVSDRIGGGYLKTKLRQTMGLQ